MDVSKTQFDGSLNIQDFDNLESTIHHIIDKKDAILQDFSPIFQFLRNLYKQTQEIINLLPHSIYTKFILTTIHDMNRLFYVWKDLSFENKYIYVSLPAYIANFLLKLKPNRLEVTLMQSFYKLLKSYRVNNEEDSVLNFDMFYTMDYDEQKSTNIFIQKDNNFHTLTYDMIQLFSMSGFFTKLYIDSFSIDNSFVLRKILRFSLRYFEPSFQTWLYHKILRKYDSLHPKRLENIHMLGLLLFFEFDTERYHRIEDLYIRACFVLLDRYTVEVEKDFLFLLDRKNNDIHMAFYISSIFDELCKFIKTEEEYNLINKIYDICQIHINFHKQKFHYDIHPLCVDSTIGFYNIDPETVTDNRFFNKNFTSHILAAMNNFPDKKFSTDILIQVIKDADFINLDSLFSYFSKNKDQAKEVLKWLFDSDDHFTYIQHIFAILDLIQDKSSYETQVLLHSLVFNPNHALTLNILQKYLWLPLKDVLEYYLKIPLKNAIFYHNLRMRKIWVDVNDNSHDCMRYIQQCYYTAPTPQIIKRCAILGLDECIQDAIHKSQSIRFMFEIAQTNYKNLISFISFLNFASVPSENYLEDIRKYPYALIVTHYAPKFQFEFKNEILETMSLPEVLYYIDCACELSPSFVRTIDFPDCQDFPEQIWYPILINYRIIRGEPFDDIIQRQLQLEPLSPLQDLKKVKNQIPHSIILKAMKSQSEIIRENIIDIAKEILTDEEKVSLIKYATFENIVDITDISKTCEGFDEAATNKIKEIINDKNNIIKIRLFASLSKEAKVNVALDVINSHSMSFDIIQNCIIALNGDLEKLRQTPQPLNYDPRTKRIISDLRMYAEDPNAGKTAFFEINSCEKISTWLSEKIESDNSLRGLFRERPSRIEISLGEIKKLEPTIPFNSIYKYDKISIEKYFLMYFVGIENGIYVLNSGKPVYAYYGLTCEFVVAIGSPPPCWSFINNECFFEISLLLLNHGYSEPLLTLYHNPDFAKYAFDNHIDIILGHDVLSLYTLAIITMASLYKPYKELPPRIISYIIDSNHFYLPAQVFLVLHPNVAEITSFWLSFSETNISKHIQFLDSLIWAICDQEILPLIAYQIKRERTFRIVLLAVNNCLQNIYPVTEEDLPYFDKIPREIAIIHMQHTEDPEIIRRVANMYDDPDDFMLKVSQNMDNLYNYLISEKEEEQIEAKRLASLCFQDALTQTLINAANQSTKTNKIILRCAEIVMMHQNKIQSEELSTIFYNEASKQATFTEDFILLNEASQSCGEPALNAVLDVTASIIDKTIWVPAHEVAFSSMILNPKIRKTLNPQQFIKYCTSMNTFAPEHSIERCAEILLKSSSPVNPIKPTSMAQWTDFITFTPRILPYIIHQTNSYYQHLVRTSQWPLLLWLPLSGLNLYLTRMKKPLTLEYYAEFIDSMIKRVESDMDHYTVTGKQPFEEFVIDPCKKSGLELSKYAIRENNDNCCYELIYYSHLARFIPELLLILFNELSENRYHSLLQRGSLVLKYYTQLVCTVTEEMMMEMGKIDKKRISSIFKMFGDRFNDITLHREFNMEVCDILSPFITKLLNNEVSEVALKESSINFIAYTDFLLQFKADQINQIHFEVLKRIIGPDFKSYSQISIRRLVPLIVPGRHIYKQIEILQKFVDCVPQILIKDTLIDISNSKLMIDRETIEKYPRMHDELVTFMSQKSVIDLLI